MARKTAAKREAAERAKRGWETRRATKARVLTLEGMQKMKDTFVNAAPQGINPEAPGWSRDLRMPNLGAERQQQPAAKVLTMEERQRVGLVETLRKQGDVNDAARTLHAEMQAERRKGEIMGAQKASLDVSEMQQTRLLNDFMAMVAFKSTINGQGHTPMMVGAEMITALYRFLVRNNVSYDSNAPMSEMRSRG